MPSVCCFSLGCANQYPRNAKANPTTKTTPMIQRTPFILVLRLNQRREPVRSILFLQLERRVGCSNGNMSLGIEVAAFVRPRRVQFRTDSHALSNACFEAIREASEPIPAHAALI